MSGRYPLALVLFCAPVLMCPLRPVHAGPDRIAPESEVARIGAETVTLSQLPANVQADIGESERRYQQTALQLQINHDRELQSLVESGTSDYLDGRVLQTEAQARGLSVDQLTQTLKGPPVTDAQVRAFYDQHQSQIKQPFAAVSAEITRYLTDQATLRGKRGYASALRTKYAARVTLEPLRVEIAGDGPSRGPRDARITIVEFADFECPYCRQMAPFLKRLLDDYPRDVRLVYRQLPLTDLHPHALHAAKASLCAQEQGRFWEMHDALYADPAELSTEEVGNVVQRLQLKPAAFATCVDSASVTATLRTDAQAAREGGITGTPGIFVNGRYVGGAIAYEQLAAVVDDELERRGSGTAATH
jgi:protein-disulfide isomerase